MVRATYSNPVKSGSNEVGYALLFWKEQGECSRPEFAGELFGLYRDIFNVMQSSVQ